MTRTLLIGVLTALLAHPAVAQGALVGVWQVRYPAGTQVVNGEQSPIMGTGTLRIEARGDSLLGQFQPDPVPELPEQGPIPLRGRAGPGAGGPRRRSGDGRRGERRAAAHPLHQHLDPRGAGRFPDRHAGPPGGRPDRRRPEPRAGARGAEAAVRRRRYPGGSTPSAFRITIRCAGAVSSSGARNARVPTGRYPREA